MLLLIIILLLIVFISSLGARLTFQYTHRKPQYRINITSFYIPILSVKMPAKKRKKKPDLALIKELFLYADKSYGGSIGVRSASPAVTAIKAGAAKMLLGILSSVKNTDCSVRIDTERKETMIGGIFDLSIRNIIIALIKSRRK